MAAVAAPVLLVADFLRPVLGFRSDVDEPLFVAGFARTGSMIDDEVAPLGDWFVDDEQVDDEARALPDEFLLRLSESEPGGVFEPDVLSEL